MNQWVIDAGDKDFEQVVLERSKTTPVVVDFWAPWCGPCRTLGPLLERLAAESAGAFVLAKVNVDENPGLAAALNVRSIPMVVGFRHGELVSEFVGALPEAGVQEFLRRVLPSEAERMAVAAGELAQRGQTAEAEATLRRALELEPRCDRALLDLAVLLAGRQDDMAALALLDRVAPGPLRPHADRLAAEIRVREAGGADEPALRARLAADPADLESRFHLAQALAATARYEEALTEYLELVRRDRSFRDDAARKAMLDIFELLGPGDALVDRYRSDLAKVLFR
jgi:putative thioredoxin